MPVIARFNGITIRMYLRQKEHNPPHIHATYGERLGLFTIDDGDMFEGDISFREQRMVRDFILHYRDRLMEMWEEQSYEMLPSIC
jgi:hypothetical protein